MTTRQSNASAGASLVQGFDHLAPPIGPDGTPHAYYTALITEAAASGRYVARCDAHGGFWLALGYAECVEIARRADVFSNAEPTLPRYATNEPLMIAGQDDPEHRLARVLVNQPFNPDGVKHYGETIRENVDQLVDGFITAGKADLGKLIAKPIPAMVTALIMGLPAEEGPKFSRWITSVAEGHLIDPAAAALEIAEMYAYFAATIEQHRRDPGDDVLSYVVHAEVDGRRFTQEELTGFCTVLMIGGIDNTYHLIGSMLWRLAWDTALRARLIEEPALIAPAVQEFLRVYSPAFIVRVVTEDIEFHGAAMKRGDLVLLGLPIANRDPRKFPEPNEFKLERPPNSHIGLGVGIHRCLGAHLIALEARIVAEEFLRRIPDYALDPTAQAKWVSGQVSGMASVPVVFTPGAVSGTEAGKQRGGVDAWLANAGTS